MTKYFAKNVCQKLHVHFSSKAIQTTQNISKIPPFGDTIGLQVNARKTL